MDNELRDSICQAIDRSHCSPTTRIPVVAGNEKNLHSPQQCSGQTITSINCGDANRPLSLQQTPIQL